MAVMVKLGRLKQVGERVEGTAKRKLRMVIFIRRFIIFFFTILLLLLLLLLII